MTDKQQILQPTERQHIVKRAMQTAINRGWRGIFKGSFVPFDQIVESWGISVGSDVRRTVFYCKWRSSPKSELHYWECDVEKIIFSPEFAILLWGDDTEDRPPDGNYDTDDYSSWIFLEAWIYHLQQMIIAPDPITYLGEHLNDQTPN
jgi:hypothetical protein